MRKVFKRLLCLSLCLCMIFSCGAYAFAAVGAVNKITATKVTSDYVTLNWSTVPGVRGYRLYRYSYDKGSWSALKTTASVAYTDSTVQAGERYAYRVRAYVVSNARVIYGAFSPNVYVNTPPEQVTAVGTHNVTDSGITLKWRESEGVTGYVVYEYNPQTKKYVNLGSTSKTNFTVKPDGAIVGAMFRVRAYTRIGKTYVFGAFSSLYKNNVGLSNVENLKLSNVSEKSYMLSWKAVDNADGYQITRYNNSTKKWDYIKKTTVPYYSVSGLSAGSEAVYRVRAYKLTNGKYTLGNYTASFKAITLPAVPAGLKVEENRYRGLTLKWNAVKGATGYLVYSYNSANGSWELLGSTTNNYYYNNNLKETRNYTYKIRAFSNLNSVNYFGGFCPSVTAFYKVQAQNNEYIKLLEQQGVFGYLYDPAEKCFYTSGDPWQRNVGYNEVFDWCAPFTMINFDTERLYFKYDDKDWLVQLWKGQYGLIFYGAEVGVYYKPTDRELAHYDSVSDDDMLKMSLDFYVKSSITGKWSKKFSRPYGYYWWCTGFLPGNIGNNFERLRYSLRVTMKDSEMLTQFKKALDSTELYYTVNGLNVYITYI